ncbi:MAG: hypothetical protein JWO29_2097 [Arthrobacter sp.]|nr:hypothetical protein [Arthrobacter sp.]MCU1549146.1 hypothetical protein [Arthrobacter sp.]
MSQEQPPVRNRRELRQARDERPDENQEPGTAGPGAVRPASKPAAKAPASGAPGEPSPADILAAGGVLTRRQLRQLTAETAPAASAELPGPGGKLPEGTTVEQALAARELLQQQARNQVAKMEHITATDADAVDPDVLAEQIALAERAAELNRRAPARQEPAEQNRTPALLSSAPSTASNLAMVTPFEFVEVPGVERPVMKRPATSSVPIVINSAPRVETRAEAATAAPESEETSAGRAPVAANAANGLDPLDAATAGLGRARRSRAFQLAVLVVGVLALIAGITLIATGLAR